MDIGDKVEVQYVESFTKQEQIKLRQLDNLVTIDDLDFVQGELMGLYTKEFPGYLFTMDQIKKPQ